MLHFQNLSWLYSGFATAQGNMRFMVWNTFLALIPLAISVWLFRGRGGHHRRVSWWIGFGLFMAFLPNAPYVLTDIIHLVTDIRGGHSAWTISLILVPQYVIFMLIGFGAYVVSLVNLNRYLCREGLRTWVLPVELSIHSLCALGIYLGRFLRFNSWDIVTRPYALLLDTVDVLLHRPAWAIMLATFCVLASLYWLMKHMTLALILYWRTRRLRATHRYL